MTAAMRNGSKKSAHAALLVFAALLTSPEQAPPLFAAAAVRTHYRESIIAVPIGGTFLSPVAGATVYLYQVGTTTPITETIYAAPTGGTTLTNPLAASAAGTIDFYLEGEKRLDLYVVKAGYADQRLTIDVTRGDPWTVAYYGAKCDGTTDDTAALQAALDAVSTAHEVLKLPVGTCKFTSTLTVVQKNNFRVSGPTKQAGTYNSRLLWAGPLGGTALLLDGVRDTEWSDFAIDGNNASVDPAIIVEIDKIAAGSTIPRKNGFRRMLLRGGTIATVRMGEVFDQNNEGNIFEDVEVNAITWVFGVTTSVGYQVKSINAKNQQVVRGSISNKDVAVDIVSGSLHLHSVEIGASRVWMRYGSGGEPVTIENCDGDNTRTCLELLPAQSSPIVMINNRCIQFQDGDQFIFNSNPGPVTLIGNDFASGGYRAGATVAITSNSPRMVALGNVFPNGNMLPVPPVSGARFFGLYALGNLRYDVGNQLKQYDDTITPWKQDGAPIAGMGLRLAGHAGFLADAQTITGATQNIIANSGVVGVTMNATLTMTSAPTIAAGLFDGMTVRLVNIGTTNNLVLQDRGTLPSSGLALTGATVTIAPRQSIELTWFSGPGLWVQTGSLVSPL